MSDTPGWDAIDEALVPLYGDREPEHFGTIIRYNLGGPDPLDGLSAYTRNGHFHVVTYGLTELYEKQKETLPDESGWGFELTFRLAREEGDEHVPTWALNFLQNIARYVFDTGNVFRPGHYMDLNGPIAAETETKICAICFADDPELAPRDTPNGKMRFLQVVGVTLDELAIARRWNTNGLLSLLRERSDLLVTDLARRSIATEPDVLATIERGVVNDGSSCGSLFHEQMSWEDANGVVVLTLGAMSVKDLVDVLPGRIPFDRKLTLVSGGARLVIEHGDAVAYLEADDTATLQIPAAAAIALAKTLAPKRGEYTVDAALRVVVEPSEIRDQQGNVIETVG